MTATVKTTFSGAGRRWQTVEPRLNRSRKSTGMGGPGFARRQARFRNAAKDNSHPQDGRRPEHSGQRHRQLMPEARRSVYTGNRNLVVGQKQDRKSTRLNSSHLG